MVPTMADAQTALQSYRDCLEEGEGLPQATERACRFLESQGWRVRMRRFGDFRYWCPCQQQHNVWLPDNEDNPAIVQASLEMFARKSCLQVEGGEMHDEDPTGV